MANTLTGTYVALSAWGSLTVTITPAAAVTAGAMWQVDGGEWRASAVTVAGLSVASHVIAYRTATGYTTPTSETTSILADQTRTISREYVATPTAVTTNRPSYRLSNLPYPFGFKAIDEVRDYLIKFRSKLSEISFVDIEGLPTPTLGAIIYGNEVPEWAVLPGQITTTRKFLTQTGIGTVSAPPKWETFPLPLDGVLYEMLTCDEEALAWGWPGTENTFIGRDAAYAATTGSYNTLGGHGSGRYLTIENGNTFLGAKTGYFSGIPGTTTETVEATSYDLKYKAAEVYAPRPTPVCSWGGMVVTLDCEVGIDFSQYRIRGSYDGTTWTTLLSTDSTNGIIQGKPRMASFKGSLWYSMYGDNTLGQVQQWDGATLIGHHEGAPGGNNRIDQLFVWGDRLCAIHDGTPYVNDNTRIISYTDGSAPGGVPSSWTSISSYIDGDYSETYYNYNMSNYYPGEWEIQETNHLFSFEDDLYFVCSRSHAYGGGGVSTQWDTKILKYDGETLSFTAVATITPDEPQLHPCGIIELSGTVYLFLSELGSNGSAAMGDGRLVVYTSTNMTSWTLWKDFGDNYGVVCGTKYFNHRIFVSIHAGYDGGSTSTEVYYLNTSAKTLTKEATLATGIPPSGDLIEFDGYLWQSQRLNIYRRTADTWIQTLYPDSTLGSYNTFIGGGAGKGNIAGRFNTCVGYLSDVDGSWLENATAIGYKAVVSGDNMLVLGGIGANAVNVCIGRTSGSERLDVLGNAKVSGRLIASQATGTSPLGVLSTTVNTNLNADMLDGYHAAAFLGLPALTDPGADRIVFWDDSESALKWLTCGDSIAITTTTLDTIQDIRTTAAPSFAHLHLTIADGTTPMEVTSSTEVANLNAHLLQGHHAVDFAHSDAKYIVQEVSGDLSAEQSLGALATGILKNTTTAGVGVLSIAAGADLPDHSILSATHGDTTAASVVLGDIISGQGASPNTKWVRTAGNTTAVKQYLSQTGTGAVSAAPAWASIAQADVTGLTTADGPTFDHLHLTTDLPVSEGGTGKSSFTLYAIPYASGTTTIGEIAIGTAGQALTVNGGANGYTWAAVLSNPMADIGDMIIGGVAGAPAKLVDVVVGSYLRSGGVTTAPLWSTLKLPNAATKGALTVATDTNTIGELAAVGATTQILVGGGAATAPVWGTDLPTAVTIGSAYIYRASGTDVPVADGGTGLSAGTSGGILGYTAAGTLASSAALTDSVLVVGGGAGATPTSLVSGLGATTQYLRGNAGGEATFETLNQAAIVGLTTADGPTFASINTVKLAAYGYNYFDVYSDTVGHDSEWYFRRSHADTAILVRTLDTENLGTIAWLGTNATPAFATAAYLRVTQVGVTGTYVPASMYFCVFSAEADHIALSLTTSGGVHVGGTSDVADNCLLVDGTATITGAFGCNAKTAQTAYVSGGAVTPGAGAFGFSSAPNAAALATLVTNIRAALVANGIMS